LESLKQFSSLALNLVSVSIWYVFTSSSCFVLFRIKKKLQKKKKLNAINIEKRKIKKGKENCECKILQEKNLGSLSYESCKEI